MLVLLIPFCLSATYVLNDNTRQLRRLSPRHLANFDVTSLSRLPHLCVFRRLQKMYSVAFSSMQCKVLLLIKPTNLKIFHWRHTNLKYVVLITDKPTVKLLEIAVILQIRIYCLKTGRDKMALSINIFLFIC